MTYQQPLREPDGHLVLEIVRLTALVSIGRCALLLEPFCPPIEHLEPSGPGGDGVAAARGSSCELGALERGQPCEAACPAHDGRRARARGHDMLGLVCSGQL